MHSGAQLHQGDPVDLAFDEMFELVMLHADTVETALQKVLQDESKSMVGSGTIIIAILMGCFVLINFKSLQKSEFQLTSALEALSTIDPLTSVENRRAFDRYLSSEWGRSQRVGLVLSIIICDIDFFKQYNDSLGHLAGDECLKRVVKAMRSCISRSEDHISRYGGEEFTLTLPSTDSEGALKIMERINNALAAAEINHPNSSVSNYVTLSAGIATVIPIPSLSVSDFLSEADSALYRAKESGRNKVITVNM